LKDKPITALQTAQNISLLFFGDACCSRYLLKERNPEQIGNFVPECSYDFTYCGSTARRASEAAN